MADRRREATSKETIEDLLKLPSVLDKETKELYQHRIKPRKLIRRWYEPPPRLTYSLKKSDDDILAD